MPYREAIFQAPDQTELFHRIWQPEGEPGAVVVFVHGILEHGGRYAGLAAGLYRHGVAMYALDLRGHGRSKGARLWVRRFEQYVADVAAFVDHVAGLHPGRPVFLLGNSMGGAIAAWLAIERPAGLRGVILSGPALLVGGDVFPLLRRLAGVSSVLTPWLRVVRLGCRNLSRDPAVVDDFLNDPLVFHGRLPCRTGAEVLRAANHLQTCLEKLRLPLLIQHGSADVVTDPDGSRRLHARAESPDKTLQMYEGVYHDLFHEPEKEQIIADVVAWITARRNTI